MWPPEMTDEEGAYLWALRLFMQKCRRQKRLTQGTFCWIVEQSEAAMEAAPDEFRASWFARLTEDLESIPV